MNPAAAVEVDFGDEVPTPPERKRKCMNCSCPCRCSYNVPTLSELFDHDKRLIRAILLIVILLNIPYGQYILYPFMIFSTWIHELFHGLAALSVGGKIAWLNIYPNGSGLAYTMIQAGNKFHQGWVACAGYQSTAFVGGIMLMFRRSGRGARVGTIAIGASILLTCILLVRNVFGVVMTFAMGSTLIFAGVKLPKFWVRELYALMSATTCLNAITRVRPLFFVTEATIGGVTITTDAVAMENATGLPYWMWASLWILLGLGMTALGICIVMEDIAPDHDNADHEHDVPGFHTVAQEGEEDEAVVSSPSSGLPSWVSK